MPAPSPRGRTGLSARLWGWLFPQRTVCPDWRAIRAPVGMALLVALKPPLAQGYPCACEDGPRCRRLPHQPEAIRAPVDGRRQKKRQKLTQPCPGHPAGCRQKRQSCAQARGSTPDCEILLKAASLRRKPLTPHQLFPMLGQPAAPAVPLRPFHFPAPSAQQAEALRPRPAPCFSPGATSCPAFGRAMDSQTDALGCPLRKPFSPARHPSARRRSMVISGTARQPACASRSAFRGKPDFS